MKNKEKIDLIYITSHYPPDIGGLETTIQAGKQAGSTLY